MSGHEQASDLENLVLDLVRWHPRYEKDVFGWFPDSREAVAAAIESLIARGRIERAKTNSETPVLSLVALRSTREEPSRLALLVADLVDAGEAVLNADGFTVGPRSCAYCAERIARGVEVDGRFPMHPTCAELSTPRSAS